MTDMFDRNVYLTEEIPEDWKPRVGDRIVMYLTESSPYVYVVHTVYDDGAMVLTRNLEDSSYRIRTTVSELQGRDDTFLLNQIVRDPHIVLVNRDKRTVTLYIDTGFTFGIKSVCMELGMARILSAQLLEALKQDANRPGRG